MNNNVILEVNKIFKSYPMSGGRKLSVLEDINFQIREGEIVSILGPTGAGKSSLIRILAGLAKPSEGEVLYHGVPLEKTSPNIAMVFQSFAIFPWLTVVENVEIGLKAKGAPNDTAREKAIRVIDMVGLDGFEEAYPRELSGGMRQRVGLARALAVEPEILFMDEPFSALDVLTADNLRGELMELWLRKAIPTQAILMVTHNIEEAVLMADRIVVMDKDPGRVVTELNVTLHHPRHRKDSAFQHMADKVYA